MGRWTTSRTAVYNIGYHLIWCPKYRKPLLVDGVDVRLKQLLLKKAKQMKATIETMEIMPNHVHIFIKCLPVDNPQWIVKNLKGYSSRFLRKEFSQLRTKVPCLWTRSYYCESVGHISARSVKKYIEEQKDK